MQTCRATRATGEWRWSVRLPEVGVHTTTKGASSEPLDFAVVWLPNGVAQQTERDGVAVWHGPSRAQVASEVLEDVLEMRRCVAERLGAAPEVTSLVQTPRELGETAVRGTLLWLPEHEGWDVGERGFGRYTGCVVGSVVQAEQACRRSAGRPRCSDRGRPRDGDAAWVAAYAPLATTGWTAMVGEAETRRVIDEVVRAVRDGQPLTAAVARAAGAETARLVLGEPLASDVAVAPEQNQRVHIGGER